MHHKKILVLTSHTKAVLLILLFTPKVLFLNAQLITRAQIINNATPYITYLWTATKDNLWNGKTCGGRNVFYAYWVKQGLNMGMPYCWGGSSTMAIHTTAMTNKVSAGDICSKAGNGCKEQGSSGAGIKCASGLDCSGLVSIAWGISPKRSVLGLNELTTIITDKTTVKPGDILSANDGNHVRLVEQNYNSATGLIKVIESSSDGWIVKENSYSLDKLKSYTARRYNNVLDECSTVSNITVSNITESSATINLTPPKGGSSYYVAIRPSTSSGWFYYTFTALPMQFNLTASTTYYFAVAPYCPLLATYGKFSETHSFTTPAKKCSVPSNIKISSLKSTSVSLSWTAENAASYNYYIKLSTQSTYTFYAGYKYNPVTFSALPNKTYNFMVSSNCINNSTSAPSTVFSFKTPASFNAGPSNISKSGDVPIIDTSRSAKEKSDDIFVYPNPIQPGKELIVTATSSINNIALYSLDGRIVKSTIGNKTTNSKFMLPSFLSSSIYIIKVSTESGVLTKKLRVNNF